MVLNEFSEKKNQKEKQQNEKPPAAVPSASKDLDVVSMDQVMDLFSRHLTKVKRRSVKGELSNVMKQITASLKGSALNLEAISENGEEEENSHKAFQK